VQTEPLEPEYDHIRMKARDAVEVFESFEDDVDHDDLTDSEKVKEILRYVDDRKDRCFWKSMDGYDERDYMVFKGSVLEHYLGIRKTTRYYLEQLKELSDRYKARQMTLRRLTNFYSHFSPIVLWRRKSGNEYCVGWN